MCGFAQVSSTLDPTRCFVIVFGSAVSFDMNAHRTTPVKNMKEDMNRCSRCAALIAVVDGQRLECYLCTIEKYLVLSPREMPKI